MKNIIIGTAGHVDHGKTLLIKALTGIDTDRLKEEKKRGITIDIGFAFMDLPNGEKAGIIDVPGHEKFIKNMLAGAGGMDMVLLVVAADEGVMHQTREHLGILSLLDVKNGIVVLTKCDLADEEMLEIVKYDLQCELKGTFLENAPVVPVSAYTGQGIGELKTLISRIADGVRPKNIDRQFRIPVDRVFTIGGFGTVITGTLIEGRVSVGDEAEIYPKGRRAKVRKIQVHGQDAVTAYAGQRVAINLASVKKDEVLRGDALGAPGSMEETLMLDARLSLMQNTGRTVENGTTLHLYHGTRHTLCKAVLLDRDSLKAGESCYAQLRLSEAIAAKSGDRYVVRFYSPVETIGGGEILEANPSKHKRQDKETLRALAIKENGALKDKILLAIAEYSPRFATTEWIGRRLFIDEERLLSETAGLESDSGLVRITDRIIVHESYMVHLENRLTELLAEYHAKNLLKAGMRRDELRGRLLPQADIAVADRVLELLAQRKVIRLDGQKAALFDFCIRYSGAQTKIMQEIERIYSEGGFAVPNLDDVFQKFSCSRELFKQVLQSMLDNRVLVCIDPQIFLHRDFFNRAIKAMEEIQKENGVIELGALRDVLATSRKYAYAFLEYCDKKNITQRTGDLRKLIGRDAYIL